MKPMLRNNEIPKKLIKRYNVYILDRTMYTTKCIYLLILTIDLHIRFQMVFLTKIMDIKWF